MASEPREVYVFGAGFTKAFAEDAPLLLDDYDTADVGKFDAFPLTHEILKQERDRCLKEDRCPPGKLNLERLMTRLSGGMPYDWKRGETDLLGALLSSLKHVLRAKLNHAKAAGKVSWDPLRALAAHCQKKQIHCVTFNYDDLFDQALFESSWPPSGLIMSPPRWHPNWGYSFFCNSSVSAIGFVAVDRSPPIMSMLLLKLHGSLNWRVRHGHPTPYATDAITHLEDWCTIPAYGDDLKKHGQLLMPLAEQYLDPEPFIVPPVLAKSDLVEQPVLRVIWSQAFDALKSATKVTFVGYSLPVTDIAAGTLFRETLAGRLTPDDIKVVDFAKDPEKPAKLNQLRESYCKVFHGLTDAQIDLRGGLAWARAVCGA
jgi:hypothetical protein